MLLCRDQTPFAAALYGLTWFTILMGPHQRANGQVEVDIQIGANENRDWGSEQVIGEPNTPEAGDRVTAWASASPDEAKEWLICEYENAAMVSAVRVHETYNPGALTKITAFNDAEEVVLWEGEDPTPRDQPKGVSVIPVRADFAVKRLKLYIDSPAVPGWNEVDAVALVDISGDVQWAMGVSASSTYGAMNEIRRPRVQADLYAPEQAAGEPMPAGGRNRPSAWRSMSADDQQEWLICKYDVEMKFVNVVVHETAGPGAVTKITAFDADDNEHLAWEGEDPTPRSFASGVSVFPIDLDFSIRKIKIYIDSPAVPGFNEIDAVGLRNADKATVWAQSVEASSSYASRFPTMVSVSEKELQRLRSELQELKEKVGELDKLRSELNQLKESLKNSTDENPTPDE
ncbi:MAG: hypothetical protein WEB58_23925 [Planctomycetaceae bacterium]